MDKSQRDDLMERVVLPRYKAVTSDGTKLGPTWWAEQLGTTLSTIEQRVRRLRDKASSGSEKSSSAPTVNQQGSVRSAMAAIKKYPELAKELVEDDEVADAFMADRFARLAALDGCTSIRDGWR
jgi:hypothetical protein